MTRPSSGPSVPARPTGLATAACTMLLLAGCTTPIARSVVNANLAQEQATNQLLLLNIARAHERMPMHFSQIGQIRSAPGGWGLGVPSLGFEIPFGGTGDGYKMTLGNEGQSPVDVTAMTSQEFMRGMTTPLTPVAMAYFANQGWSLPLLMHLFFESIVLVGKDGQVLQRLNNDPGSADYGRFRTFVEETSSCELIADLEESAPRYLSSAVDTVSVADGVEVANAKLELKRVDLPAAPAAAARPAAPAAAAAKGYQLAAVSQDTVLRLRTPEGATRAKPQNEPSGSETSDHPCVAALNAYGLGTGNLYLSQAARVGNAASDRGRPDTRAASPAPAPALTAPKPSTGQFVLRSPESMLYYLGQLSRAQNGGWSTWMRENGGAHLLTVRQADRSRSVLFDMSNRRRPTSAASAVQVDYGGTTFSVAWPVYKTGGVNGSKTDGEAATQDRSMTTLSLMLIILALQEKGMEAPGVSNVRLLR